MTTITAHGKTYPSVGAAKQRLQEIALADLKYGPSDGRATETALIRAAIETETARAHVDTTTRYAERYRAMAAQEVRIARRELAELAGNTPADHRIQYEDRGKTRVGRYTTEEGFLRAIIRIYGNPDRYGMGAID